MVGATRASSPPCTRRAAPDATLTEELGAAEAKVKLVESVLAKKAASDRENGEDVANRPPTSTTALAPNATPPGAMNQTLPP